MKGHIYSSQTIAIGGNLDALLYAYKNNCTIILNNVVHAAPYDTVGHEVDVGLGPDVSVLELANFLKHELAMAGNLMFGPIVESVSVEPDKKLISVLSKFFSPKKIRFEKLVVFDLQGVSGMPFEVPDSHGPCRVLDWFNIRSGGDINLDVLLDPESQFVRKITFFYSKRIKAAQARGQKDMISESLISMEDLDNLSFSHSMSRLKSASMISQSQEHQGKNAELQFVKREIFPSLQPIYIQDGPIIYSSGSPPGGLS